VLGTILKFFLIIPLTLGFFISASDLPQSTLCLLKNIAGLDCPGCGLTRAFLLIPNGFLREAFELNWGSLGVYLFFILLLIQGGFTWLKKLSYFVFFMSFLLMFGGWIYKLSAA